jgi:hypothetical protein
MYSQLLGMKFSIRIENYYPSEEMHTALFYQTMIPPRLHYLLPTENKFKTFHMKIKEVYHHNILEM